jgi:hypothetical protein
MLPLLPFALFPILQLWHKFTPYLPFFFQEYSNKHFLFALIFQKYHHSMRFPSNILKLENQIWVCWTNKINRKEGYEFSERRGKPETMLEHFRKQNLSGNNCFSRNERHRKNPKVVFRFWKKCSITVTHNEAWMNFTLLKIVNIIPTDFVRIWMD